MTSEGKDRSRAHMYRFGQILVQNSPLFFLMLHTDPVSVPFFFCVMSVSTSVCITIFSILVITPNPNCSSIMPSTPLEDCPRDPHYSNVRQATWAGGHEQTLACGLWIPDTFSIPWSGSDALFKLHSNGWKHTTFLVFSDRKLRGMC